MTRGTRDWCDSLSKLRQVFAAVPIAVAEQLLGIEPEAADLRERRAALEAAGATPIGPPERDFWALPDHVGERSARRADRRQAS